MFYPLSVNVHKGFAFMSFEIWFYENGINNPCMDLRLLDFMQVYFLTKETHIFSFRFSW